MVRFSTSVTQFARICGHYGAMNRPATSDLRSPQRPMDWKYGFQGMERSRRVGQFVRFQEIMRDENDGLLLLLLEVDEFITSSMETVSCIPQTFHRLFSISGG